jgi:DNA-directed RNA polymerase omega subunit
MPLDNLTELKRRVPGGKYNLARAVAERARQLQSGEKSPLVEVKTPNPLSVAIDEIVQGKISFTTTVYKEPVVPAEDVAAEDSLDETLLAISDEAADAQAPDAGLESEVEAVFGDENK